MREIPSSSRKTAPDGFPRNKRRNVGDELLPNIGKEDVWEDQSLTGEIVYQYPSVEKEVGEAAKGFLLF